MLVRIEGNVYFCMCDTCHVELRRDKRGATKRTEHYCDAKCVMRAVREGKIIREVKTIDDEVAKQDPRRLKKCAWCSVEYIDVTKRNVGTVCSKKCAYELGVATRKTNGSYVRTDEMNAKASITLKKGYATGRLRCHVTPEILQKAHDANRGPKPNHWTKTLEARKAISERRKGWNPSEATRAAMSQSAQNRVRNKRDTLHSSACGGLREDLGMYFRSRWEANFARVLNHQGKKWSYESDTFLLDPTSSYTPDFLSEGTYYELKGRWYEGHREKVVKFQEQHPDLLFVIIEEREYRELSKQYKMLIPNWEGK